MQIVSAVKGSNMQKEQHLLLQNKSQTVPFTGGVIHLPWDRVLFTIKWRNFSDVWRWEKERGATEFIFYDSSSLLLTKIMMCLEP